MRTLAKRLIVLEATGNISAKAQTPADFAVLQKLRPALATLMGNSGFRALLARALALASGEVPALRAVQVKPDATLEGVEQFRAQFDADEFFESKVEVLAQLIGLLVTFIGEDLTARLVGEAWPQLKPTRNDLILDNETKK